MALRNQLPKRLGPTINTEFVTIIVGKARQRFGIHKKLICHFDFFRTAFTGQFKESQENTMDLPEDDPDAFNVFVDWLYRSTVPDVKDDVQLRAHFHLYMLAEKLCLNELANKTMDQIKNNKADASKQIELILGMNKQIYDNSSGDMSLRPYVVHSLLYLLTERQTDSQGHYHPHFADQDLSRVWKVCHGCEEFFKDFVVHFKSFSHKFGFPKPSSPKLDQCFFHRHAEGETCHLPPKIKLRAKK